jgi:NAD(P)-dependent dehydrogenase (short-subunit alcohol dehydrogenase family)
MDLLLTDKLALVSGSTKGIGQAIAKLLAQEGARVIVNGRSEKSVAQARRFASTDEVASLVAFVCSPLSLATNGPRCGSTAA